MTEENFRIWDIGVKIIAPLITVFGLLLGLYQFTTDQKGQLERQYKLIAKNDEIEFKRRLWAKQLEVYMNVSNVVGKIASDGFSKPELDKNIRDFDVFYWGHMLYFEDKSVEQSMIDFHVEIRDYKKGIGTLDDLKVRAKTLVSAFKQSSKKAWFIDDDLE